MKTNNLQGDSKRESNANIIDIYSPTKLLYFQNPIVWKWRLLLLKLFAKYFYQNDRESTFYIVYLSTFRFILVAQNFAVLLPSHNPHQTNFSI